MDDRISRSGMNRIIERLLYHGVAPDLDDAEGHHQEGRDDEAEFDCGSASPVSCQVVKELGGAHDHPMRTLLVAFTVNGDVKLIHEMGNRSATLFVVTTFMNV